MELRKIRGIGNVYESKLKEAGIKSIEDLITCDLKTVAEKTGINIRRLEKWKEEGKRFVEYKEAEIIEDIGRISFVEIEKNKARVKIKEIWHENVKVYRGNFEEIKNGIEDEIAVYIGKKAKLWFNGKWHDIPYKVKEEKEKKSFIEKLKEWWRK